MANKGDIYKVALPNGDEYNFKDKYVRENYRALNNNDFDTINVTELNSGNLINTGAARFLNTINGSVSGTSSNVTGTVAIANGGTGATTRLSAAQNLTNEAVTSPTHIVGLTTNWGKFGYTTIAQLKSTMSLNNVENKSSATIRGELTSSNVTTALGYTPVNKAGDTMSGALHVSNTGKLIFDWTSNTDCAMFVLKDAEQYGIRYQEGNTDKMKFSASGNANTDNADLCINGAGDGTVTIRGNTIIHAGNYTSYTVKKDGTGASGTWGISVSGNAATATKATQDESGNNLKASYASSFSISDHTITLKNKNGDSLGTVTIPDDNTTYTLSTSGNNVILNANGTTQDTITVPYATSAGSSNYLVTPDGRATSADIDLNSVNRHNELFWCLSSSSMTTSNPGEGYLTTWSWDWGGYGAQLFMPQNPTQSVKRRCSFVSGTSDWGDWITLLDSNNYTSYTYPPSSHTHPVSDLTWAGGVNLTTTASANNQEWSIDLTPGSYTGTYWHVWSGKNSKTILACYPDNNSVQIPNGTLLIQNAQGANAACMTIKSTATIAANTFQWGINHLVPNMSANGNTAIITGVANSSKNAGALQFHYAGSSSDSNCVELGLYGADHLFSVYGNGDAKLNKGTLHLFPDTGNYAEGIRIHATSNWSDIVLCGNDNTGDSGTSANSWFIGNNNGNFHIMRNGSSSGTAGISCVSNAWKFIGNVTVPILGIEQTNGTSGGISLYGGTSYVESYGICFRKTSNRGVHGYVSADWATYFTQDNTANRGWVFQKNGSNTASISSEGNMVLNGSLTLGGNSTNTSGVRQVYNATTQSLDFVFVA